MKRAKPLNRSAFKRPTPAAWIKPERTYTMPTVTDPTAFRVPVAVTTAADAIVKSDPVRCKPYLRAVAGLRCIHCGVLGYSQCAHANTGKGASIKVSDLDSFPLCTVHPGPDGTLVQGCHERFDQGALFSKAVRRELEPAWAADTQRRILAMGLWPKNLPRPVFLEEETTMTEPDEAKNDIERKMLQGLGTELNHQSHEVLNFHMTGQVGEDPTGTIWTVPVAKGVVDVIIKEIRA